MRPANDSFNEITARPQQFRQSFMRMAGVLWRPEMARWRPRMAAALVLTLVAKGFSVWAPVLMGAGINAAIDGGGVGAVGWSFTGFILAFGAARFLSNGLPQLRDAFFTRVTQDAKRLKAVEAFRHAQHQSLQFHLTRRAGALNTIIDRGANAMEFMLRFLAFNIGPTLVELVFAAAVMAALYSVSLAGVAVATIALYAIFTIIVTEWRNGLRRAMNEADSELRAVAMDTLTNFETVKSFAAEDRESDRYSHAMSEFNARYVRSMQSMNTLNAGQELIMTAGLVAVVLGAGFNANLKVGDITAVILMLTNIYRPITILGFAWREIKQGAVDIEKLFDLLDQAPGVKDHPSAVSFKPCGGRVEFERVSFVYDGRASGLESVSFEIEAGTFVGLVGPSGAGKSTILRLLYRFYEPNAGVVRIDDQDVSLLTQTSLRAAMGLVPQEVALFNDTLRFNLAYGRPATDEAALMKAIERAQLSEFVNSLPDGLETRVGERGLKLSGGEKQRVGLARAILLDPPILILDEATSSLDSHTEKEVQRALNEAAKGRTTIAVAHRLSTLAGADKILVFDDGRVVEEGTPNTLLSRDGLYAALWREQVEDGDLSINA